MIRIALFHPRKIWMPTIFGWFFLLAIALVISLFVVRNIYSFLAQNEPVGARVLVIEGWLAPKELDQAVQTFKKGGYERVVTTGGPILGWSELSIHSNYAKMAADYLAQHGVPRNAIIVVPTPASAQERTFLSAVALRDSAQKLGITLVAIDLYSSGAHSRRSRLLFQMALGQKVRIGVLAGWPSDYDPDTWWRSSSGVESIVFQSIALLWVKCCFWPGPPGSQQELWDAP
ncbi:MAG TPA: ElyC/SanA/YdcF family protein [Gallionellaceae bacterium]|nr:ElyC/SanA/YdcF family protein [Gallionellaceae bacterium]